MSLIRLPDSTVRLLGSSQVITSVSSVVKELLENALDAGASNVEIRLEKHGLEKIEVKDDGCGIEEADCLCMALPHYTSKITDFTDLEKIQSYGFRGEALYSLCSVAKVSVVTKMAKDDVARSYKFGSDGQVLESKISHGLKGIGVIIGDSTTVTVSDLFADLPVRRRVASANRRAAEELRNAERIVKSLAVVQTSVRVSLAHNKFLIWQKTAVSHLKLAIMQVIPSNIVRQLHHIFLNNGQIRMELFIPKMDCDIQSVCMGQTADCFHLFINKRPIKSKTIEKVFSEAFTQYFGLYIPPNKSPVCFIIIVLPPDDLDVNLEPNKTKIYIKNEEEVLIILKDQLSLYYSKPDELETEIEKPKPKKIRKVDKQLDKEVNVINTEDSYQKKNDCVSASSPGSLEIKHDAEIDQEELISIKEVIQPRSGELTNKLLKQDNNFFEKNEDGYFPEEHISRQVNDFSSTGSSDEIQTPSSIPANSECSNLLEPIIGLESGSSGELRLSQWSRGGIITSTLIQDTSIPNNQESLSTPESNFCIENNPSSYEPNLKGQELNQRNEENMNSLNKSSGLFRLGQRVDVKERVSDGSRKNQNDLTVQQSNLKKETDTSDSSSTNGMKTQNTEIFERSISSQMGRKEMSAFTKFAREMHSDIIKEMPGMTFTAVASSLATGWRNLQETEKERYEEIASKEKEERDRKAQNLAAVSSCKNSNNQKEKRMIQTVIQGNSPKKKKKIVKKSTELNVNISAIKDKYNKRLNESSNEKSEPFEILGQVESTDFWLYKRNISLEDNLIEIGAINILHLEETYSYHKNLEMMIIPTKILEKNLPVTVKDVGSDLWNILLSLERDSNGSICDKRIIMNGFRIDTVEDKTLLDTQVFITDVALNINFYGVPDLQQTLVKIQENGLECSVTETRCLNAIKYIKSETIRRCTQSKPVLNKSEDVFNLTIHWLNELNFCDSECPHGKSAMVRMKTIQS